MKHYFYFSLVLFLALGCQKKEDVCPDTYELGDFTMVESSRDFLPYVHGTYVIFVDENLNELRFRVNMHDVSISYYEMVKDCELASDTGKIIRYNYSSNERKVSLYNLERVLEIKMNVKVLPNSSEPIDRGISDVLSVYSFWDEDANGDYDIIHFSRFTVAQRTNPDIEYPSESITSQVLLGRTFKEVTKIDLELRGQTLAKYFNKEYGLIGFTDLSGVFWRFDRVE